MPARVHRKHDQNPFHRVFLHSAWSPFMAVALGHGLRSSHRATEKLDHKYGTDGAGDERGDREEVIHPGHRSTAASIAATKASVAKALTAPGARTALSARLILRPD
jgi:hypothetical protein